MKNAKKAFALVLALLMTLSAAALVSCGEKPEEGQDTGTQAVTTAEITSEPVHTDENGFELDKLPEKMDFGKETFTFLAWDGQSYEEFDVAEASGDMVENSIFTRNARVEDRLNCEIAVVKTKGGSGDYQAYTTQVKGDAAGGSDNEFDILAAYSRTVAMCAYQGLTADLNATEYFNGTMPWWPETLLNQNTVGGKLFFCSGDISLSLFHNYDVIYFNKSMADDLKIGADNIYKTVDEGKWTLAKMIEMCEGAYKDSDGDNAKSEKDTFGFIAANTQSQPIVWGCGITAIETDKNGVMAVSDSFTGEKMQHIQEILFDFLENNANAYKAGSTGTGNTAFAEGRCLFFCNIASYTMSKFNVDGLSYGILPPPKYDEDQEKYYSVEGNAFTLYAIEKTDGTDADKCSALLEALCSEGYRTVSPVVFEAAMKMKYASDYNTSRMFDLIRASVVFDNGRLFSGVLDDIFTKTYNNQFAAGDAAWMSKMASVKDQMIGKVEALNKAMELK